MKSNKEQHQIYMGITTERELEIHYTIDACFTANTFSEGKFIEYRQNPIVIHSETSSLYQKTELLNTPVIHETLHRKKCQN